MKATVVRLFLLLFALALVTGSCANLSSPAAFANLDVRISDVYIDPQDFDSESMEGMVNGEEGLIPDPGAADNFFESRSIRAPIAFNAVVPQWIADLPGETGIELEVRTSVDGKTWGPWIHSHASADWTRPEDEDIVGEMLVVPETEGRHRWAQYRVAFEHEDSSPLPSLRQLRLTFIDSTKGPTSAELVAQQEALEKQKPTEMGTLGATSYPKPLVVSRAVWCQHADCVYSEGLEYYPVSHLIVHHTVSSNSSADWAATVRAIWSFHTYTREWGDVGYNYLIDPNGVIYEGHYGGDDVVGTHASGANAGSMAVALLGTFTRPDHPSPGIQPPAAMQNAAVELLSWKADQRNIDIFDASDSLPNISWGLPHLMGHRDVYGTTECPGDQAHLLIPSFRQRIAQKIGLTDPHFYVDELSSGFSKTPATYYEPPYLCGYNNHAWYAWSTTDPAAAQARGEWRPSVPADGRYRIDAYVPYCKTGRSETTSARYTITHADGTTTRQVDMNENVGLWITLGEFNLRAGTSNVIQLTNLTNDNGVGVWFDALRLLPTTTIPTPVVVNSDPQADSWRNVRVINFNWQIANPGGVTQTRLEISTDPNFADLLTSQSWVGPVTNGSFTFAQDYSDLYWRVILEWSAGSPIIGAPSRFRLDATPPEASMGTPQLVAATGLYRINWAGSDGLSGLAGYNVDYRVAGQNWVRWLSGTTVTNAGFYKPDSSLPYEFRVQAMDVAGNAEVLNDGADVSIDQAVLLPYSWYVPSTLR